MNLSDEINQIIFLIILVVSFACNSPSIKQENHVDKTLIFNASTNLTFTIIHPVLSIDGVAVHILPLVFNGLLSIDKNGNLISGLADSYEINETGLEYRIKLKKDIKFYDGKELTSEDVKFSYEQFKILQEKNFVNCFAYNLSLVNTIDIIDKYNLKISLKTPFAPFIYTLSLGILPKHVYKGKALDTSVYRYPTGTGAFKLIQIDDKKIVLEKNDEYFKGMPQIDKIFFEINNPSIIWAKLLRGEIDCTRNVSKPLLKEIKKADFLKTYDIMEPCFYMLFFNCQNELFKDKRIRQALNYAIDKELLIKNVLMGYGEICNSPILPNSKFCNRNIKPYEYDPQQALKILEELGWIMNKEDGFLYKEGKIFEFNCILVPGYIDVLNTVINMQQQLDNIGIKMEIKMLKSVEDFYTIKQNNNWDCFFVGQENIYDPDRNYNHFHSSKIGTSNIPNYNNPEIDYLLDQGRKTFNVENRLHIYNKFQEILLADPPGIFAYYRYTSIVLNNRVENASPTDFEVFNNIENWRIRCN